MINRLKRNDYRRGFIYKSIPKDQQILNNLSKTNARTLLIKSGLTDK